VVVRGRIELPTFRFSGALSPPQTKSRKMLAALLTGVSAGQQASQPFYRSAELYRGVPFRLWDFCGDRRRIAELWGFCGARERTQTTQPALPTLAVTPTAVALDDAL